MPQSPHAQLREHQPGFESTGDVDAGVDHARSRRKGLDAHAEIVGPRRISIGERPRPLVHPELTHHPLHRLDNATKITKITKTHMTRLACALLVSWARVLLRLHASSARHRNWPRALRRRPPDCRRRPPCCRELRISRRGLTHDPGRDARLGAAAIECRSRRPSGQDGHTGAHRCPQPSGLHRRADGRYLLDSLHAGEPTRSSPPLRVLRNRRHAQHGTRSRRTAL